MRLAMSPAFDQLYLRHELPLWRYILRHSGNRSTAEELMQEVWFAVAREATRFRRDARFTSWLYTMARNRIIDRYRTSHPHVGVETELLADELFALAVAGSVGCRAGGIARRRAE